MNGKIVIILMFALGIAGVVVALSVWHFMDIGTPQTFRGRIIGSPLHDKPADSSSKAKIVQLVRTKCGACHATPNPKLLTQEGWASSMRLMEHVMKVRAGSTLSKDESDTILGWLTTNSPEEFESIPKDAKADKAPLSFLAKHIGKPLGEPSTITNVNTVDLDQDGRMDVIVCEPNRNKVSWLRYEEGEFWESDLADIKDPAHTEVFDFNGDGFLDIVVASLGSMKPTEEAVGGAYLLINDGNEHFEKRLLLEKVGRVADIRPADFDGDGDVDFVLAIFGYINAGRVAWLEQKDNGMFTLHSVIEKNGAVNVPVLDLNGDGKLDFVALIAQEHEEIIACINDGNGGFKQTTLYQAGTPLWGSSGIQMTDLDQDGDMDILASNGDAFDLYDPPVYVRPYHGVRWLENTGELHFTVHELTSFYGAYRAVAADMDNDGDLDIVASSLFNDWRDPSRHSLIWLENNGQQSFTRHNIATGPTHLITCAVGDLDSDGRVDIVTGGFHIYGPYDRKSRVTFWKNNPAQK